MEDDKGKWIVHEWGDKFQVVESQVRIKEKPGITMRGQRIIAKEITKANAYLMAAAPKMNVALKKVMARQEVENGRVVARGMPSSEEILEIAKILAEAKSK